MAPATPRATPRATARLAAVTATAMTVAVAACTAGRPSPSSAPGPDAGAPLTRAPFDRDSLDPSLVPAGYGTLRQEDVTIRVQYLGLVVRLLPLDESVIRTLSPDAYAALRDLLASRRAEIEAIARRYALARPQIWYVSFYGVQQGETRFSPLELTVTSSGRDFRPVDAIPLTPGFGAQRLAQREAQAALYVFDGAVDVDQPLVVTFQAVRSTAWDAILRRVERERSLIRSRATRSSPARDTTGAAGATLPTLPASAFPRPARPHLRYATWSSVRSAPSATRPSRP
ncbi:MAG TPA: hypothetical protein VFS08_19265 [Gemmatimonadaceae bacterium]|nr:hypothetical protein [Gemmatimonadaceae bacterium]